jgi:hypothetical protein
MTSILISKKFKLADFHQISATWKKNGNVSFSLVGSLTDRDANRIVNELLDILPDDAGFCLLENLVDSYSIADDLLIRLFSFNDTACNVSICLGDNLSEPLHRLCAETPNPDVREHYFRCHPSQSDAENPSGSRHE